MLNSISTTQPIVLVFVGMPGAGKSSCIEYVLATRKNLPPVPYFGGIVVDEVKRRGLKVNEANERAVREEIRAKEGKEAYAKRIAAQVDQLVNDGHQRILVDGLYSWSEYRYFKQKYGAQAVIIAVAAPRHLRHQRLLNRPVRPLTEEQATAREYAEIENIEKGGPIANADFTLTNGQDINQLQSRLDGLLEEIDF